MKTLPVVDNALCARKRAFHVTPQRERAAAKRLMRHLMAHPFNGKARLTMLRTVLIVVLVLVLLSFISGFTGFMPPHFGYGGGGLGLIILIILVVLLLRGRGA